MRRHERNGGRWSTLSNCLTWDKRLVDQEAVYAVLYAEILNYLKSTLKLSPLFQSVSLQFIPFGAVMLPSGDVNVLGVDPFTAVRLAALTSDVDGFAKDRQKIASDPTARKDKPFDASNSEQLIMVP